MNIQDLEYCNFGDYSIVRNILSRVFEISDFSSIQHAYEIFKNDFHSGVTQKGWQTIPRESFKPIYSDKTTDFYSNYFDKKFTVGSDLPVLVKNKDSNTENCVFIVSQDPLREGCQHADVLFSTPFATHVSNFREKKNKGKIYWDFALWLLDEGFSSVYFTDIKKIWVKEVMLDSNRKQIPTVKQEIPKGLLSKFAECLEYEFDLFKPSAIITFGNEAKNSIPKHFKNITIEYLHPSPSMNARSSWKRKYEIPNTLHDTRLSKMKEIFYEQFKG